MTKIVKAKKSQHRDLCLLAARWLRLTCDEQSCSYVAVEIIALNSDENPDVIGWGYGISHLIEVKTTRADFLSDSNKPFRVNAELGMGGYRYYCCPAGLIKEEELPRGWGLLYEYNGKIRVIRRPSKQPYYSHSEVNVLLSIMRREGVPKGIFNYTHTNKAYYKRRGKRK